MSNEKLTMDNIYQRLEEIGFSKEFVKSIGLPSWWCEELDNSTNTGTIYEGAGHISKRLCLELKSLLNPIQKVRFKDDMNYERVVQLHRYRKIYMTKNPLSKKDLETLSPDTVDYLEQVVDFKF